MHQHVTNNAPCHIHVQREVAPWRDRHRAYTLVLDGQIVGQLRQGESLDTTVAAGKHTVAIKIDWAGSRPYSFSIGEGESVHFVCSPNGSAFAAPLALFRPGDYVALRRVATDL
jgi:hypothetical protein